jgi:hypothetical protein
MASAIHVWVSMVSYVISAKPRRPFLGQLACKNTPSSLKIGWGADRRFAPNFSSNNYYVSLNVETRSPFLLNGFNLPESQPTNYIYSRHARPSPAIHATPIRQ